MAIVSKNLPKVPKAPPGAGMAPVMKRAPLWSRSQNFAYTEASGAQNLFQLPGNALIVDSGIRVKTAFDSTAALVVIAVPNDTGTETLYQGVGGQIQTTGWISATTKMVVTPASGGFATISYTPASSAAGALEVYLSYILLHDEI